MGAATKGLWKINHLLIILFMLAGCQSQDEFYETLDSQQNKNALGVPGGDDPIDPPIPDVTPTPDPTPDPSIVSDQFIQSASEQLSKFDIVWVIDNSGSMGDEQAELASNFDLFIQDFVTQGLDFKMAITTTDNRFPGEFVPGSTALTAAYANFDPNNFISDFQTLVQVGTQGSGNEQGLFSAKTSVELAANQSFFRSDAFLVYVIVSDENDHHTDTASTVVNSLSTFKGQNSLLKIYSIVKKQGDSLSGTEEIGDKYIQASQMTGSDSVSIDSGFSGILANLGGTISQLATSFVLSVPAEPTSIEVRVDGQIMLTGWTYNGANNAIAFDAGSVPQEGAQIEIRYLPL